jgi:hypothetical protein
MSEDLERARALVEQNEVRRIRVELADTDGALRGKYAQRPN